jgi:1,4-dihydroxy-2-naphthoate octaprenyltransferase
MEEHDEANSRFSLRTRLKTRYRRMSLTILFYILLPHIFVIVAITGV